MATELGVSVSSLYYKHKRPFIDLEVKSQIEAVLLEHPAYGHKRITLTLKLSKKRILRVMKKYNIKPYRRRAKKRVKKDDLNKPETIYTNFATKLGIKTSMSDKGSPWENGYQESFYSHFKLEGEDLNRFTEIWELLEHLYTQI